MRLIKAHDLSTLHVQTVKAILKNCYKNKDGTPTRFPGESFEDTIEHGPMMLVCDTPLSGDRFIKDKSMMPFSQAFMDEYTDKLINGYGDITEFEYDYHQRLFVYEGYSKQMEYVVDKLRASPSTRRAIAITWMPSIDTKRSDVPCLQFVHFTVRQGKLNMEAVFRSEDMLLGLGPNMYGLVDLQNWIAQLVDKPIGTYTHVAFCPHLYYWRDQKYLENFI